MRRCLTICAMALAGCGADPAPPAVALLDLSPCAGWSGRAFRTEGDLLRAAAAERHGRLCANQKLKTVSDMIHGGQKDG